MRASTEDRLMVAWGVFLVLFIIGGITFTVWAEFFAPCGDLGWLPIHEIPGRCLTFVRHN